MMPMQAIDGVVMVGTGVTRAKWFGDVRQGAGYGIGITLRSRVRGALCSKRAALWGALSGVKYKEKGKYVSVVEWWKRRDAQCDKFKGISRSVEKTLTKSQTYGRNHKMIKNCMRFGSYYLDTLFAPLITRSFTIIINSFLMLENHEFIFLAPVHLQER